MRLLRFVVLAAALSLCLPMLALPKIAYLGMSAALPGSGEIALGKTTRGAVMLGVDILALNAWWATDRQKDNLTRSYLQYAKLYAGTPEGMDDRYYQHLQEYDSSAEFNQFQELMARNYYLIYTYDPEGYAEYIAANTYTPDEAWDWQGPGQQEHYRSLRRQTQTTKMYQNLSLGVILLNRVISVIDVALLSRQPSESGSALYFTPLQSGGLMLNYRREF